MASSSSAAVPTQQAVALVAGLKTELLVQEYDDQIMAIVTQVGKVGSWTQATLADSIDLEPPPGPSAPSSSLASLLPPPSTHISLLPLMGVSSIDPVFSDLIVSQIATLIWWIKETNPAGASSAFAMMQDRRRKKVVVGLGLKKMLDQVEEADGAELERQRFEGIMELVAKWSG